MFINNKLKKLLRSIVPMKYQTVLKYYYNKVNSTLEQELEILEHLVRKDDLVIDIGGNRGVYAYKLWKLGTRVEVFEPNPICYRLLEAWACGKPSVNIHTVALSNHAGTANLHIPIDESGVEHDASASIENSDFEHSRDQPVSLQTLDRYEFKNVSFIKIDVEGHEYDVIEGAASLLASFKPALLVEIEQRHNGRLIDEVFGKILGFGYQGFFMRKDKLTLLKNFDHSLHQSMESFGGSKKDYINNFLFLHEGRLADGEYAALVKNI